MSSDIYHQLPAHLQDKGLAQKIEDAIENSEDSIEFRETYKENLVRFSGLCRSIPQYLGAVKFCSYILMEDEPIDAYKKAYPDRYMDLINKGRTDKEIKKIANAHKRNKLVSTILEQAFIPVYLLNNHLYQKAINTQATLMMTANSEFVRSNAADSLMRHLKPPEAVEVNMNVNVQEDDAMKALKEATLELAKAQLDKLKSGGSIIDIAEKDFKYE